MWKNVAQCANYNARKLQRGRDCCKADVRRLRRALLPAILSPMRKDSTIGENDLSHSARQIFHVS